MSELSYGPSSGGSTATAHDDDDGDDDDDGGGGGGDDEKEVAASVSALGTRVKPRALGVAWRRGGRVSGSRGLQRAHRVRHAKYSFPRRREVPSGNKARKKKGERPESKGSAGKRK